MENDKELCTSKIKNIAKNSYKNFKVISLKKTNQKIFLL